MHPTSHLKPRALLCLQPDISSYCHEMVLRSSALKRKYPPLVNRRILSSICLLLPPAAKSHWFESSFLLAPGIPGKNNNRNPFARKFLGPFTTTSMPERYDFTSSALNTAKLDSPSAQRNKDFIWNILSQKIFSTMPPSEKPLRILEIAAGCGVHVEHFATQLASSSSSSSFEWYPTDLDEESRKSIEGYIQDGKLNHVGVQPPLCLTLDANGIKETETLSILFPEDEAASTTSLDLMICINMIHISPWSATLGLMKLAGERLKDETGVLYCYGPYKEGGTAVESNL